MVRSTLLFVVCALLASGVAGARRGGGGSPDSGRDFYKILDVPRDASQRDIKKAYRKASLKYHPDKNPGDDSAAAKYTEINVAYDALSDPDKRRKYDQFGEEGLNAQAQQGGRDPFADFFGFGGFGRGGGGGGNEMDKGQTVRIPLRVTLKDLYLGRTFKVAHKKQMLCSKCRGTGAKDPEDVKQCPVCKGSGVRMRTQQIAPGFVQQFQQPCDKCGGKGKLIKEKCPACGGSKVDTRESPLTVIVERGMADRTEIPFENQGDETPEEIPGDVVFVIDTVHDARFRRESTNNLRIKTSVSLLEALVGFTKSFEHLDGHKVTITRNDVTVPGHVEKIVGEGMPVHNDPSTKGDLFVEFSIRFPRSVPEANKDEFRRLLGGGAGR